MNTKKENEDQLSKRLKRYYDSVQEEAIPDRFLDLLEQLDKAESQQKGKPGSDGNRGDIS